MKLGLIAMSGLRALSPELTELGLTLPGFLERNRVIASLPSLSLLTLAGMTPRAIDISYLEIPDLSKVLDLPGEFDVVGIASYSAQIKDAYRLADRYRQQGTKVILGGLHVTALPQEASAHADCLVLGEAESVWPEVIKDLQRDDLQPLYDARPLSFDLAKAPMPRFDLLEPENYNRLTVQTQRGCPFNCEFCAASLRIAPKFKVKPVEKVISEIRKIKEIWPRPFIEFADDNSFANRAHAKRLLRALAVENVRWFTETDISLAEDGELLALLRDSGCAQVLIGLESPTRKALDGLEKSANWKAKQLDRYRAAIERIQSHGIAVNGCFILGLDGTDSTSFAEILDFAKTSNLYDVQVTLQTAFPGTPLYGRLRKEGRLLQDDAWETCTLFDVNFQPENMSVAELENGFRGLVRELYSDNTTQRRRKQFRKSQRKASLQE